MVIVTTIEMARAIGQEVYFVAGTLKFLCRIKDVKVGWGNPRFLIVPVSGNGERWCEFTSLSPVVLEKQVCHKQEQPNGIIRRIQ